MIKNNMSNFKQNKSKGVVKATFWYLVCDFILRGMSFITMPIFTRMMTPGQIGDFSILTTWISLFSVTITLNLSTSVIIAKIDYKNEYDQYISSVTILGTISSMLFYAIILPLSKTFANLFGLSEYALHIMCIYLIFCQSTNILLGKYRAQVEYKKSVAISLGSSLVITIVSVICTLIFPDALKGRIYGTYLTYVLINAVFFLLIILRGKTFQLCHCNYALSISLPLVIHNLAGNIMHSSDRIMIGKMCSSEEAGIYGVAYTCAMFANILRNSMNTAWNPWIYEKISCGREKDIKRVSYIYLSVFFILCSGIILSAPEILMVLGGETYLLAKDVVPPVVTAYMFSMVYSLYGGIEQYYKKQKKFAIIASLCAVVNIGLNFMLIPIFGYITAAYTTLISSALECFFHYKNVKKMGFQEIYNTKFNFCLLIGMFLFNIVSFALYRANFLRYLSILIYLLTAIIIVIRRKDYIQTLTSEIRKD